MKEPYCLVVVVVFKKALHNDCGLLLNVKDPFQNLEKQIPPLFSVLFCMNSLLKNRVRRKEAFEEDGKRGLFINTFSFRQSRIFL